MKFRKGTVVCLSNSLIVVYLGNKHWLYPGVGVRYKGFLTNALEKYMHMYNAKLL